MSRCIACRQGFTWECETNGGCTNSTSDNERSNNGDDGSSSFSSTESSEENLDIAGEDNEEFGRVVNGHNDAGLRDQQSTGRKRAAVMYPLDREADCEWKMKKNVGGGPSPIMGCINGKQQARHHGPDKNTLNNDLGNVHRICVTCHNRWHTVNDEIYIWGIIQNSHSPVEATIEEMAQNEMYWAGRKLVKANDDK